MVKLLLVELIVLVAVLVAVMNTDTTDAFRVPPGHEESTMETKKHARRNVNCGPDEFMCNNKECIPGRWACDNENDCSDGGDEANCDGTACNSAEFSCGNGQCIPLAWKCDGESDCGDDTDEDECSFECPHGQHTCDNGKCIPLQWTCDKDNDCGDNSDEVNCPVSCIDGKEFLCVVTNDCISITWKCDGDADCKNGTDEEDCTTQYPIECGHNEFMCDDNSCIHKTWRCDGDSDCSDGSDERECPGHTCGQDQFTCDNGDCITDILECDGERNCPDGSDESKCATTPEVCDAKTHFQCDNGNCIEQSKVCDNMNDCSDWSDEPSEGICSTNECDVDNGGCAQVCQDLPIGHICSCSEGYEFEEDSKTCVDTDECKIYGQCSQICNNTEGEFTCSCLENYELGGNNRTCKPLGQDPLIIFSNRMDIRELNIVTHEYGLLVSNVGIILPLALDYDYQRGYLYWSDVRNEQIARMPIGGGEKEIIIDQNIHDPDGIAIDWIYHNIYWTDTATNDIEVAALNMQDGIYPRAVLINDNLDEPRAIALDPLEGYMYWSDWGDQAKIEKAGMNGMHRQTLVDTDIQWPNGITIDYVTRRIYWVDARLNRAESVDLNGDNRQTIISSETVIPRPFSVDVFGDYIYWTDWDTNQVHRANKCTGGEHSPITEELDAPMGIRVYHALKQQQGHNYCDNDNGKCSHLCVAAPNVSEESPRYSCLCPEGVHLLEDGHACDI